MDKKVAWVRASLKQHKTLWVTLVLTAAAAAYPGPAGRLYGDASMPLIVALFALLGLMLDVSELQHALASPKLHFCCQSFSLILTPFVFYVTLYRWGFARHILTSRPLAIGTMATMCLPTTTNTNVMFTQQAGGEVSATAINAALGNLLGAFATPVTVSLTIGSGIVSQDIGGVFLKIFEEIVAPLLGGLAIQLSLRKFGPEGIADKMKPYCHQLSSVTLVLFLYFVFCKAFAAGGSGVDAKSLFLLVLFLFGVHLSIFGAAWVLSKLVSKQPEQQVAFIFSATQKTESLGVAILTAIFKNDDRIGALTMPIVIHHTVQMIVAACAVARARRLIDDNKVSIDSRGASSDASYLDGYHAARMIEPDDGDLPASSSLKKKKSVAFYPPQESVPSTADDSSSVAESQRRPLLEGP